MALENLREQKLMFIAIRFADDSIAIMNFVKQDCYGRITNDGEDEHVEEAIRKCLDSWSKTPGYMERLPLKGWWNLRCPTIKEVRDMVGNDRSYRRAWRFNKDARSLYVDMDVAKEKHMELIRIHRDEELKQLDIQWMKAFAKEDKRAAGNIEIERQRLRDIPQNFDLSSATTPEELKALWPEGVTNRWTKEKK